MEELRTRLGEAEGERDRKGKECERLKQVQSAFYDECGECLMFIYLFWGGFRGARPHAGLLPL